MSAPALPNPILITRQNALQRLAGELGRESIIAVDTESNSLYAYRERVCLIQFSTSQHDYLVDPLALDDLSSLAPVFQDERIEKVFHAAEYDLICLERDYGFRFANLFDTMLAARILGWEAIGLGSILEAQFGVQVDKRYQRADWGKRPLPPHQLSYAQLDTHYLIPLRQSMYAALQEKGLWPLAVEDFTRMSAVDGRSNGVKSEDCWRVSGANDLPPQNAAVLRELCRYRDQAARAADRPLFKVISDRTLLEIAAQCPTNQAELSKIGGMTEGQVARHGRGLLEAVRRGQAAEPLYPPRHIRPDDRLLERLEALRNWRKITARKLGVNSDVVLPRELLYAVASQNPRGYEDLESVLAQVPWRVEHFGGEILEAVRNPREYLAEGK
jgi:ribonuclease D